MKNKKGKRIKVESYDDIAIIVNGVSYDDDYVLFVTEDSLFDGWIWIQIISSTLNQTRTDLVIINT